MMGMLERVQRLLEGVEGEQGVSTDAFDLEAARRTIAQNAQRGPAERQYGIKLSLKTGMLWVAPVDGGDKDNVIARSEAALEKFRAASKSGIPLDGWLTGDEGESLVGLPVEVRKGIVQWGPFSGAKLMQVIGQAGRVVGVEEPSVQDEKVNTSPIVADDGVE